VTEENLYEMTSNLFNNTGESMLDHYISIKNAEGTTDRIIPHCVILIK